MSYNAGVTIYFLPVFEFLKTKNKFDVPISLTFPPNKYRTCWYPRLFA